MFRMRLRHIDRYPMINAAQISTGSRTLIASSRDSGQAICPETVFPRCLNSTFSVFIVQHYDKVTA